MGAQSWVGGAEGAAAAAVGARHGRPPSSRGCRPQIAVWNPKRSSNQHIVNYLFLPHNLKCNSLFHIRLIFLTWS